jgi:hypothetical protein
VRLGASRIRDVILFQLHRTERQGWNGTSVGDVFAGSLPISGRSYQSTWALPIPVKKWLVWWVSIWGGWPGWRGIAGLSYRPMGPLPATALRRPGLESPKAPSACPQSSCFADGVARSAGMRCHQHTSQLPVFWVASWARLQVGCPSLPPFDLTHREVAGQVTTGAWHRPSRRQ